MWFRFYLFISRLVCHVESGCSARTQAGVRDVLSSEASCLRCSYGIRLGNRTTSSSLTKCSRQSSSQNNLRFDNDTNPRGPMTPLSKRTTSTPRSSFLWQCAQHSVFDSSFSMRKEPGSRLSSFDRFCGRLQSWRLATEGYKNRAVYATNHLAVSHPSPPTPRHLRLASLAGLP